MYRREIGITGALVRSQTRALLHEDLRDILTKHLPIDPGGFWMGHGGRAARWCASSTRSIWIDAGSNRHVSQSMIRSRVSLISSGEMKRVGFENPDFSAGQKYLETGGSFDAVDSYRLLTSDHSFTQAIGNYHAPQTDAISLQTSALGAGTLGLLPSRAPLQRHPTSRTRRDVRFSFANPTCPSWRKSRSNFTAAEKGPRQ